jgi:hypothetical protein
VQKPKKIQEKRKDQKRTTERRGMAKQRDTVWSTRHFVTGYIHECKVIKIDNEMATVQDPRTADSSAIDLFGLGNEWHYTREEAVARFNQLVSARLKSVERSARSLRRFSKNGPMSSFIKDPN